MAAAMSISSGWAAAPLIQSAVVDYAKNRIVIGGQEFSPAKAAPVVTLPACS